MTKADIRRVATDVFADQPHGGAARERGGAGRWEARDEPHAHARTSPSRRWSLAGLAPAGADAEVATVDQLKYPPLPAFSLPKPTRTVLPNGLVVLVMEDHELPLVSVSARIPDRLAARAGREGRPGQPHGIADAQPAAPRRSRPTRSTATSRGAPRRSRPSIGDDSGSAGMSVLKQDFADVLQVFSDVLRQPRFDQAQARRRQARHRGRHLAAERRPELDRAAASSAS